MNQKYLSKCFLLSTFKYPTRRSVHEIKRKSHESFLSTIVHQCSAVKIEHTIAAKLWPCYLITYKIWLPPQLNAASGFFFKEDNDDSLFLLNWSNYRGNQVVKKKKCTIFSDVTKQSTIYKLLYLKLIHVVKQKLKQHCKAIILQFLKKMLF